MPRNKIWILSTATALTLALSVAWWAKASPADERTTVEEPALESTAAAKKLPPLHVEFMQQADFLAGSKIKDKKALGGFGKSNNFPQKLGGEPWETQPVVGLAALLDSLEPYAEAHAGFEVVLYNGTDETQTFHAADSRLSIVREAVNDEGEWAPIEYLPWSSCGNSFHRVFLGPGEYWSFVAPRYEGTMYTSMRFVLKSRGQRIVTSNTFDGWINPTQFVREEDHLTQGL